MNTGYFTISGENCFAVVNSLIKYEYQAEYEKVLYNGMLYCIEEFVYLNVAKTMVVITIEKVESNNNQCEIEIIVGGGRITFFSFTAGNERRSVRKLYNRMVDLCNGLFYEISILEEQ